MNAAGVRRRLSSQRGSSLAEFAVSAAVTSLVSGIIVSAMLRLGDTENTIGNRTEMHAGIRGAMEIMQHEIAQAGRIALPAAVALPNGIPAGAQTAAVTSAAGMFAGEQLVIDTGAAQETVSVTSVDTAGNTIAANFANAHPAGAPVTVRGAFASGIVPPALANGSTPGVLKVFGDVDGTGTLVYVEYTCDTGAGRLYRTMVPITAGAKPALTGAQVLLSRILPNPGGVPCFAYDQKSVGADTYVVDVGITLTVQTEAVDPVTNQRQQETQSVQHVSSRNVFEAWELASLGVTNRIQPMPASVGNLLP